MNRIEKEKLIKTDIASIENRVRHAFNQGYNLGYKEGKANCSEIPTGSTTKNYLSEEDILELKHRYGDEVEFVVKDMLTGEGKRWDKLPSTEPQVEIDNKKTMPWYLEPFKQAIEALGSNNTLEWLGKNCKDLGVDAISRVQTQTEIEMNASRYTIAKERGGMGQVEWSDQLIKVSDAVDIIRHLPSVAPQEPQTFKWCTDCKEYDQEKHCCHRWSKVIRDTVEEMKQEQFINKSCISSGVCEHDKQRVLDKIDEIITDALDKSTDQKESQTLRWVLDKISEVT